MILKTFPDSVSKSSKIYQYIDGNEINEKGVYWNHNTISEYNPSCLVNRGAYDVSKKRVMSAWEDVTGLAFEIDTSMYKGIAVEKSNDQYTHDGRIVECPIKPRKGKVYQRFIDSSINDTQFSEYRVFYHWCVDFVIEKIKDKSDQWGWKGVDAIFHEPMDVFTKKEITDIEGFCKKMDIQFTELDVMRDYTGIYVIDVNNIAGNGSKVLDLFPEAENRYKKAVIKLCNL